MHAVKIRPWLCIALLAAVPAAGQDVRDPIFVDVRQGTDLSVTTVPGADFMVIELLGRLWRLPITGGAAQPLTDEAQTVRHPRLSEDAGHVVYQKLSERGWDIWMLDLASERATPVTAAPGNELEPDFLPGGAGIVFAADRSGRYDLWSVTEAGASWMPVSTEPGDARYPDVAENGAIAYVVEAGGRHSLRVRANGLTSTVYETGSALGAPAWRPGGGVIVFQERAADEPARLRMALLSPELLIRDLSPGEDVFSSRIAWLDGARFLYAADGQLWQRRLAGHQRRPVHLFATAIVAATPRPGAVTNVGTAPAGIEVAWDAARDVAVMAYAGQLWVYRNGVIDQLTHAGGWHAEPLVDPAGRYAIYTRDTAGERRLWQLPLEGDSPPQPLSPPGQRAFSAALDASGSRLAWMSATAAFSTTSPAQLNTLYLDDRALRRSADHRVQALDAPHWLEDNRDAVVTLPVLQPDGTQSQIAFDAALRPAETFAAEELPAARAAAAIDASVLEQLGEQIEPLQPVRHVVIQAGRLFDGVGTGYRRHVDIHIESGRIADVVARGRLPLPAEVIDATELTVLPGFIDVHVHDVGLLGELAGRAWLAFGVTTVRSLAPQSVSQQALEAAWMSGRLPGPRIVRLQNASEAASGSVLRRPPPLLDDPFVVPPGEPPGITVTGTLLPPLPITPATAMRRYSPGQLHYQDVFSLQAAAGSTEITSLAVFTPGATSRALAADALLRRSFEQLFVAADRAAWLNAEPLVDGTGSRQVALSRFLRAGTRLAVGTETPHTPPGLGEHIELALLAAAGVPNDQVLRTATSSAALALGLEQDIGTVEPGRRADLVIIAGDPLETIDAARSIVAVVRDGRWIDRDQLLRPDDERQN